jgi:hypothetical protein
VRCPDGSDYLCWKNLFEFTVSADGRSVVCGPLDQSTNESLETYLLGPVLSFALAKQGREPLHATAVIVDGKAIAFLGASGSGKSTLAAAFVRAGYQLLTDDLLLVDDVDGVLCGFPGPPRLKLFAPVAEQMLPVETQCAPMNPDSKKVIVPLERSGVYAGPVPLHGFFVLDEPERDGVEPRIDVLVGAQAFLELVRATFNTRLLDARRLHRQFFTAQDWIDRIPVRRLGYPRTFNMLERVCEALVTDVRTARPSSS